MNTFLGPSVAGISAFILKRYLVKEVKVGQEDEEAAGDTITTELTTLSNGILAGLVGITAGAD